MIDRNFLWFALAFYAAAALLTIRRLRGAGTDTIGHRLNVGLLMAGFAAHTLFLFLRGQQVQRCPLTNAFEVQVFAAWAMALFYLIIGPAYRMSLLGAFTAPVVSGLCLMAMVLPETRIEAVKRSPWVEAHAAIAILAWGAFALAAIIGAMYLIQRHLLKSRHGSKVLFLLPSLDQMETVMWRLVALGTVLFSVGMAGGVISQRVVGAAPLPKMLLVTAVWGVYFGLVTVRVFRWWHGRRFAVGVIAAFAFSLLGFWGVSWLTR
jgi:ABC-type uncharacterized transport system permease subunit